MSRLFRFSGLAGCLILTFLAISKAQDRSERRPGGPGAPDIMLVEKFDADNDGRLNENERALARKEIQRIKSEENRPPRRPRGVNPPAGKPGPKVTPAQVTNFSSEDLFDTSVLRTVFLTFKADDWEQQLQDFKPTDVEVPATMMVDGKEYPNVGVGFRGASSFFHVSEGSKRSFSISMDYLDDDQKLLGYKSLNFLNCNGDASMMSSALYSHLAGKHIPVPKVNFVKVVVNGRSWGIYSNAQQFNKTFLKEHFGAGKGTRWKVKGSPRGDGGLRYLGEDVEEYKSRFEIKSKDKPESWARLINLCKVLNETPQDQLIDKLKPILDIDSALWFLAYDVGFINSDGYWVRASDYSIFLDKKDKFHIIPHDMNESFREMRRHGGPGGRRGGPGGGRPRGRFGGPPQGHDGPPQGGPGGPPPQAGTGSGFKLDPLTSMTDRFPLRSKLLAIPELQQKYLAKLKSIAANDLEPQAFAAIVAKFKSVIETDVKQDTRKLMTNDAFETATQTDAKAGLNKFAIERANYLLTHPKIKALK